MVTPLTVHNTERTCAGGRGCRACVTFGTWYWNLDTSAWLASDFRRFRTFEFVHEADCSLNRWAVRESQDNVWIYFAVYLYLHWSSEDIRYTFGALLREHGSQDSLSFKCIIINRSCRDAGINHISSSDISLYLSIWINFENHTGSIQE